MTYTHPIHMVFHMKTTLEIPEPLMRELKERAAREGVTMSSLVEGALRQLLGGASRPTVLPPLPAWRSGGFTVDVDRRASWLDQLEDAHVRG